MPKCDWCGGTFDELQGDGGTHDIACSRELAIHNKRMEKLLPKKNDTQVVEEPEPKKEEVVVEEEPKKEEKPKPKNKRGAGAKIEVKEESEAE